VRPEIWVDGCFENQFQIESASKMGSKWSTSAPTVSQSVA
jgi:hypothetical protein